MLSSSSSTNRTPHFLTRSAHRLLILACFLSLLSPADATPLSPARTPEPLQPWRTWVLDKHPTLACPSTYHSTDRRCAWPSTLELTLTDHGGTFHQQWTVYAESSVPLPGSSTEWPLHVTRQHQPVPVLEHNETPHIHLEPGTHHLRGSFTWPHLPDQLLIPEATGLLSLTINGRVIAAPLRTDTGHLWLKSQSGSPTTTGHNTEDIRVSRYLTDAIPFTVTTHIELNVSGEPRELLLGTALLPNFIPLEIKSVLPSRLEPTGHIRTQIRPGHWVIELTARAPDLITELTLPEQGGPWSPQGEEFWSVELRPELRVVELSGLEAVDPKTTVLPEGWGKHPTFRITPGQRLQFHTTHRGESETQQDPFTLHRDLWLDFTGTGLTTQDRLTGTVTHTWRITALPDTHLGQVNLNGIPQFITKTAPEDPDGIEIRQGQLTVTAESRIEHTPSHLAATGWDLPIQHLSSVLHLPPGWSVFHAWGPDLTSHTWISQWTLFDTFLVLVLTLATARLYSIVTAICMGLMLVLTYHEPNAPHGLWAHLLIASALLKGFPHGKIHTLAQTYRLITWLLIALVTGPFAIHAIRTGLYPQLLYPGQVQELPHLNTPTAQPEPAASLEQQHRDAPDQHPSTTAPVGTEAPLESESTQANTASSYLNPDVSSIGVYRAAPPPRARLQTGPGLPIWRYSSATFTWNGPVQPTEHLSIWLMSPTIKLWSNVLSVCAIVLVLSQLFLNLSWPPENWTTWFRRRSPIAILVSLIIGTPMLSWATAFPPDTLLTELEARITQPPPCHPQCATISMGHLELHNDTIHLRLESHSALETALPLPGRLDEWTLRGVSIDSVTPPVARDNTGILWVTVPAGTHQILINAQLPARPTSHVTFPLAPHHMTTDSPHWTIDGLHNNHLIDSTLQLTRTHTPTVTTKNAPDRDAPIPSFLLVERTLTFDLSWHITTRVQRLSPLDVSLVDTIPLLPGESITSDHIKTKHGAASIHLNPNQASVQWDSVLAMTPTLTLQAPAQHRYVEIWHLQIDPLWHPTITGLPAIHHRTPTGALAPTYHPWPGESLSIELLKTSGTNGSTLTIDNSHLAVTPGSRTTKATLDVTLRSSQGGQHILTLPEHSVLTTVTINGQSLPLQLDDRSLRIPIRPGTQTVHLDWQEPRGLDTQYRSPSVALGAPSVNHRLSLTIPHDRWPIAVHGPGVGPAVLFWGVLLMLVLFAAGLSRLPSSPLSLTEWLLLGLGLSQVPFAVALPVVIWILAVQGRAAVNPDLMSPRRFNTMQVGIVLLTLIALGCLTTAIQHGLLGTPSMSIDGNGSTATQLEWYLDRADSELPPGELTSLSIYWFRGLMLLWSLWMASALIRWLKEGYLAFTAGGYWKSGSPITAVKD